MQISPSGLLLSVYKLFSHFVLQFTKCPPQKLITLCQMLEAGDAYVPVVPKNISRAVTTPNMFYECKVLTRCFNDMAKKWR